MLLTTDLVQPTQLVIANVAVKLGVFRTLLDAPKQTLTIDELATTCGTDVGLMSECHISVALKKAD